MDPDEHSDMMDQLEAQHNVSAGHMDKMDQALGTLKKVRAELDTLHGLGDAVSAEDIVKMGGGLVAAGLSPESVASLISEAPPSGDALVAWIAKQDQDVTQREQQAQAMQRQVQHHAGVNAARMLMGQAHAPQAQAQASTPTAQAPSSGGASAGGLGALAGGLGGGLNGGY